MGGKDSGTGVEGWTTNEEDTGQRVCRREDQHGYTWELSQSVRAALTKISQTGQLKQQTFISQSSGLWEIQDQSPGRFSIW